MKLLSRKLFETNVKDLFKDVYDGDIDLEGQGLTRLPTDLPNEVNGDVDFDDNELISLEGSPAIVKGTFYCQYNKFKNLKGGPEIVEGDFYCSFNNLESLDGGPKEVGGDFWCQDQLNGKEFTEEEIRSVCKVKGGIYR